MRVPDRHLQHLGAHRRRACQADESPHFFHLHPRLLAGAGGHDLTVGSGTWFHARQTGPHRLRIHFRHNSSALLSGFVGWAEGRLRFAGSVFGASERRFVDRGGFGTTRFDVGYFSLARASNEDAVIEGQFDAQAGGAYYCAGRIACHAGAFGLLSVAKVESNAFMDVLQVCTVP